MRIIAGTSGGIPIKVPRETTRPTTDRVREAIFSSLGDRVVEAQVLDLFAGSGALGLESISRGAQSAIFIEESRHACKVIEENLEKTRLAAAATVRCMRVERYLTSSAGRHSYDLVFADPPYARDETRTEVLNTFLTSGSMQKVLSDDGILILESYSRVALPVLDGLRAYQEKVYGDTRISFFYKS